MANDASGCCAYPQSSLEEEQNQQLLVRLVLSYFQVLPAVSRVAPVSVQCRQVLTTSRHYMALSCHLYLSLPL